MGAGVVLPVHSVVAAPPWRALSVQAGLVRDAAVEGGGPGSGPRPGTLRPRSGRGGPGGVKPAAIVNPAAGGARRWPQVAATLGDLEIRFTKSPGHATLL